MSKKTIEVVFTGPAATRDGRPIVRADLIAHVQTKGYRVANRVTPRTSLLVASRVDTVKVRKASAIGVMVLTYGAQPDKFVDDAVAAHLNKLDEAVEYL